MEVTSRGVADADKIICSGHNLKYNLVKLLASLSRPNNLSFEVGCLWVARRHVANLLLHLGPQAVHL